MLLVLVSYKTLSLQLFLCFSQSLRVFAQGVLLFDENEILSTLFVDKANNTYLNFSEKETKLMTSGNLKFRKKMFH